jgi:hypothetical protein
MTPIPEVEARFVPVARPRPGDAVGDLVILCPWCRKTHHHGAGGDLAHLAYGHRVAHCDAPGSSAGYVLVPEVSP